MKITRITITITADLLNLGGEEKAKILADGLLEGLAVETLKELKETVGPEVQAMIDGHVEATEANVPDVLDLTKQLDVWQDDGGEG